MCEHAPSLLTCPQGFSRGSSTYRGVTAHPSGRWEARIGACCAPAARALWVGRGSPWPVLTAENHLRAEGEGRCRSLRVSKDTLSKCSTITTNTRHHRRTRNAAHGSRHRARRPPLPVRPHARPGPRPLARRRHPWEPPHLPGPVLGGARRGARVRHSPGARARRIIGSPRPRGGRGCGVLGSRVDYTGCGKTTQRQGRHV